MYLVEIYGMMPENMGGDKIKAEENTRKVAAAVEMPKAKEYAKQYLFSKPDPIPPLKAYTLGTLAHIEMVLGNNAEAEKKIEEAKALDPHFSWFFGIPWPGMFDAPDKPDHHFHSFFSPF